MKTIVADNRYDEETQLSADVLERLLEELNDFKYRLKEEGIGKQPQVDEEVAETSGDHPALRGQPPSEEKLEQLNDFIDHMKEVKDSN